MKILAIGDPHGDVAKLRKIPKKDIDLIILTGDLGRADLARKRFFENVERKKKGLKELEYTLAFEKKVAEQVYYSSIAVLKYLSRFAPVYFIYGNVEPYGGERKPKKKKFVPWFPEQAAKIKDVKIINNKLIRYKDATILGLEYFTDTCWVKEFKPKDYEKAMETATKQTVKARKVLQKYAGEKIDVFVHHQPPFGYLDRVGGYAPKDWHGKHAGSKEILKFIEKNKPQYSFCGHIHEGEGKTRIGKTEVYNLGVCGHTIVEI